MVVSSRVAYVCVCCMLGGEEKEAGGPYRDMQKSRFSFFLENTFHRLLSSERRRERRMCVYVCVCMRLCLSRRASDFIGIERGKGRLWATAPLHGMAAGFPAVAVLTWEKGAHTIGCGHLFLFPAYLPYGMAYRWEDTRRASWPSLSSQMHTHIPYMCTGYRAREECK